MESYSKLMLRSWVHSGSSEYRQAREQWTETEHEIPYKSTELHWHIQQKKHSVMTSYVLYNPVDEQENILHAGEGHSVAGWLASTL